MEHLEKQLASYLERSFLYKTSEEERKELNDKVKQSFNTTKVDIQIIGINNLKNWTYTHSLIHHESNRFFKVVGLSVQLERHIWQQPIILQDEIGILGLICSEINGVLKFLVKLKIEPGNLGLIQLSPTVQATKSNYERVHGGRRCELVDIFLDPPKDAILLLDNLLSEQNSRFYRKRNRNILIYMENFTAPNNYEYHWMTLSQIKEACGKNNLVNMDLRSIVSGINLCVSTVDSNSDESIYKDEVISGKNNLYMQSLRGYDAKKIQLIEGWVNKMRVEINNNSQLIDLGEVSGWSYNGQAICHCSKKYFSILGCKVNISNREVSSWDQPLISSCSRGIIVLMIRKSESSFELLLQLKPEAGCQNKAELSPTIQTTNSFEKERYEQSIYRFYEKNSKRITLSTMQSEEGGRFYQEQNMYSIMVGSPADYHSLESTIKESPLYEWIRLSELVYLIKNSDIVSQQLRSVVAMIENAHITR